VESKAKYPRVEEKPAVERGPRTELTQDILDAVSLPPAYEPPPDKSKWNYRQTLRLVREILQQSKNILPPHVRIWHDNGTNVRIGMQKGDKKVLLGGGETFQKAFENVFLNPLKAREQSLEAEGLTPLVASDVEEPAR